jgi:hypothetical protein
LTGKNTQIIFPVHEKIKKRLLNRPLRSTPTLHTSMDSYRRGEYENAFADAEGAGDPIVEK